jgi:phosphatidylserine synthase
VLNLVRSILTALGLLAFSLFAVVSCLRVASFGDRFPPPPPGFYEGMSISGLVMFVVSIVGMVALLTYRPRPLWRASLLFGTVVILVVVPLVLPRPADVATALDLAGFGLILLAPVLAVALFYLAIGARSALRSNRNR